LQYFLSYANHSMGMCKDLGTRLNYAMTIVKPLPNLRTRTLVSPATLTPLSSSSHP